MKNEKILFLTGASSDIGNAIIRKEAEQYQMIWAHYCKSRERIDDLKEEYGEKIVPIQADFSDRESTQNLTDRIAQSGKFPNHIVHLSANKTFNQKLHKCAWEDYQRGIDISVRSAVIILHAFVPEMIKKRNGKIVFMLSDCVIGMPPKFQSPYVTVKYALLGLMRTLAAEYAGRGITVNAVSPDMMETRFLSDIPQLIIDQSAKDSPLGRNLKVDEVISAFEYLLSDGADAVTGENIKITGGKR